MSRRLPLIPTLFVLAAAGTMIALGVWQLERRQWKEALLARYQRARAMSAAAPWPGGDEQRAEAVLYRYSSVDCVKVFGVEARAGRNAAGASGWAHVARCETSDGEPAKVALGWSRDPRSPRWSGGEVAGFIAPGPRLVATSPKAGLEQLAAPDPNDIPNNHLAYAVQWFFFAATALVIYALALRKRWRE